MIVARLTTGVRYAAQALVYYALTVLVGSTVSALFGYMASVASAYAALLLSVLLTILWFALSGVEDRKARLVREEKRASLNAWKERFDAEMAQIDALPFGEPRHARFQALLQESETFWAEYERA